MDPRKPDAQNDDASIVDDFGREERIRERSAEVHPVSTETEVVKIFVTDDRLGDPLQMFQPEFDETEPPPGWLGIQERQAVRPARPTASRNPMTLLMARLGNHRLGYRPVSTVGIATISMILLGSALLRPGDVSALLDDLVFGRDDTSPVLEVRPRAVVTQDAAVLTGAYTTPITATRRPAKVQQPRQAGRNLVANVIPRTRVRETASPRPSRPGSAASLAITPPSPLPATLERERLAPRVDERSAVPPAPSLPPVAAAVAPPRCPRLVAHRQ